MLTGGGQLRDAAAAGHRLEGRGDLGSDEGEDERHDVEAQQGLAEEEEGRDEEDGKRVQEGQRQPQEVRVQPDC